MTPADAAARASSSARMESSLRKQRRTWNKVSAQRADGVAPSATQLLRDVATFRNRKAARDG